MGAVIKNRFVSQRVKQALSGVGSSKAGGGAGKAATPGMALKAHVTPVATPMTATPIRPPAPAQMPLAARGSVTHTVKQALNAEPPINAFIESLFPKTAADAARDPAARTDELLDMNSTGGAIADYIAPGNWGGTRAGKAQQLAEATGQEPGFRIKHPVTSSWLSALGGGLGGAGLGAAAGAGLGALGGNAASGVGVGAGLGAAIGSLGSVVYNARSRRGEMGDIANRFRSHLEQGKRIKPKKPEFSSLASLLAPFRGPHRAGQADTYEALKRDAAPVDDTLRNTGYAGQVLLGHAGPVIGLAQGWGQNVGASEKVDRVSQENARPKPRSKVAVFIDSLFEKKAWPGAPAYPDTFSPKSQAHLREQNITPEMIDSWGQQAGAMGLSGAKAPIIGAIAGALTGGMNAPTGRGFQNTIRGGMAGGTAGLGAGLGMGLGAAGGAATAASFGKHLGETGSKYAPLIGGGLGLVGGALGGSALGHAVFKPEREDPNDRRKIASFIEKLAFGGMSEPKMMPPPTTGAPPPPSAPGGPASASPALPAAAGQPMPMPPPGAAPAAPPAAPPGPPPPPPGGPGGVLPPEPPPADPAAAGGAPPAAGGPPGQPPPQPGDPAAAGGFPPLTEDPAAAAGGAPPAPPQPQGHNDPGLSLLSQGPKQPEGLFDGMDHDGQIAPPVPGMFQGSGDVPQQGPSGIDPMLLKQSATQMHHYVTPPSKSAMAFGEKMAAAVVPGLQQARDSVDPNNPFNNVVARPAPLPFVQWQPPAAPQGRNNGYSTLDAAAAERRIQHNPNTFAELSHPFEESGIDSQTLSQRRHAVLRRNAAATGQPTPTRVLPGGGSFAPGAIPQPPAAPAAPAAGNSMLRPPARPEAPKASTVQTAAGGMPKVAEWAAKLAFAGADNLDDLVAKYNRPMVPQPRLTRTPEEIAAFDRDTKLTMLEMQAGRPISAPGRYTGPPVKPAFIPGRPNLFKLPAAQPAAAPIAPAAPITPAAPAVGGMPKAAAWAAKLAFAGASTVTPPKLPAAAAPPSASPPLGIQPPSVPKLAPSVTQPALAAPADLARPLPPPPARSLQQNFADEQTAAQNTPLARLLAAREAAKRPPIKMPFTSNPFAEQPPAPTQGAAPLASN